MPEFLLPLFPLQMVLLPRTDVALHIFEERYKLMISECLQHGWDFGIVLAEDESIATTGCTASIEQILRKYDDGRMDIMVRGQRRFEVLHVDEQKPYARCECHFFEDEENEPDSTGVLREKALALYEAMRPKIEGAEGREQAPEKDLPDREDPQLSFQIASRLPADRSFRQSLLPMQSESERLQLLISYLPKLEMAIRRATQARTHASSNGRAR